MHQVGQVAAVVQDHVEGLAVGEDDGLLNAPDILLVSLALPGVDGDSAGGDGGGGVVLGGEDVAGAPGDLGPQLQQRLDEHRGLDGHVQTARDPGAGQRLLGTVDLPEVHQTGHLVLGKGELLAAPVSQGDVSYKGYKFNIWSNGMCHEV